MTDGDFRRVSARSAPKSVSHLSAGRHPEPLLMWGKRDKPDIHSSM